MAKLDGLKIVGIDAATLTLEERQFLTDVLPPTRDPKTGRYLRGKLGAGRKGGLYNFRSIVADYIEAHGGFVEDAIIDLFHSMMGAARRGDVAAAKLLLDKFCGKDAESVDVVVAASTMSDTERAARLNAILAAAAARQGQPRITVEDGPNATPETRRG